MSPMDADCSALIAAGWGAHTRDEIPADWATVKGPDEIRGTPKVRNQGTRRKPDALPKRTDRNGHRLPLTHWTKRRATYLLAKYGNLNQ